MQKEKYKIVNLPTSISIIAARVDFQIHHPFVHRTFLDCCIHDFSPLELRIQFATSLFNARHLKIQETDLYGHKNKNQTAYRNDFLPHVLEYRSHGPM